MEDITSGTQSFALVVTALMVPLILFLPRKWVLGPFLLGALYLPTYAYVELWSFHLYMFRILILFGLARLLIRGEFHLGKLNRIDKAMSWLGVVMLVNHSILLHSLGAAVTGLGVLLDSLGSYLFFRCVIQDVTDIKRTVQWLALLLVILGVFLFVEYETRRNFFSVFGGVPTITTIREGVLRCQGPFGHPISAGTFAATLFPSMVALWWQDKRTRKLAMAGALTASMIVFFSGSSGPTLALAAAIVGLLMWRFRSRMQAIRWGIGLTLVALHFAMQAPVWALMGRIGVFSSSSSYHRYMLIDNFIRRFDEWWLFGTESSSHWGRLMGDVSNNYVRTAVDGGLLALILQISIIAFCFGAIGRRISSTGEVRDQLFFWGIGVSLFAHTISFFGFSYWDQILISWYLLVAMIGSISSQPNQVLISQPEKSSHTSFGIPHSLPASGTS